MQFGVQNYEIVLLLLLWKSQTNSETFIMLCFLDTSYNFIFNIWNNYC